MSVRKFAKSSSLSSGRMSVIEPLEGRALLSVNLPYGTVVKGDTGSAAEVDEYTFHADEGAKVQLFGTALAQTGTYRARFHLFGPRGQDLNYFEAGSNSSNSRQIDSMPETGTYTLKVADSSLQDKGSFTINLECVGPSTEISPNPTPLVKGGIVDGSIVADIDAKMFVFNATAGDKIQLTGTALAKTGSFRGRFHLWGPGGEDLNYFEAGSGQTNFRQIDSMPFTGQYMIEVTDSSISDTGTFSVGLETVSPPSPDAEALVNNKTASGSIARTTEIRQYTFNANAGDDVTLVGTALAKTGSFRGRFHLWGPGGEDLDYFEAGSGQTNSHTWTDLPFTGKYVVTVADSSISATGTYTLRATGIRATPPSISKLLVTPDPSGQVGADVTLTASKVSATATKVAFYRESNGQPGLQVGKGGGKDTVVLVDTKASDGWKAVFSTKSFSVGAYTYYARAFDASGQASNTVSKDHTLTPTVGGGDLAGVLATDATAAESSSGLFTVYRKGQAKAKVSIVLQLDGTAAYTTDFTFTVTGAKSWVYNAKTKRLSVTLSAGAKAAYVRVDAVADKAAESAETVKLTVLTSTGYELDDAAKTTGTVTLVDRPVF